MTTQSPHAEDGRGAQPSRMHQLFRRPRHHAGDERVEPDRERAASDEPAGGAIRDDTRPVPIDRGHDRDRDVRHNDRDHRDRDDDHGHGVRDVAALRAAERHRFGGIRVGAGFFGWMTATGLAVLMTALADAIGRAVGTNPQTSIPDVTTASSTAAKSVGWGGTFVLLIIIFLAYLGGGYAGGRMARFAGLRQGLVVWLWGVIVAVIIAIVAALAGQEYDILGRLNDFPRIPIQTGHTPWGLVALIVLGLAALLGSLLGGLAGMSYHRRVDRAPLKE